MTPDDFDRLLADTPTAEPSRAFSARVMQGVQLEAAMRRQHRPVWTVIWPGVFAASVSLPLFAASRIIEQSFVVDSLGVSFTQLVGLTLGATLALAAWCAGILRQY